jgi:hypothetical protein
MRIAYSVSVLLLIGACTSAPGQGAASGPRVSVTGRNENGRTRLELHRGAADAGTVLVDRDDTVDADADPNAVDVIADLPGVAVAIADQYPSAPGALSFCQAGDERFLRVVSLAGTKPAQTLSVKVASCRDNLELSEPAIEWVADGSLLRIHWLTGPNGAPEMRAFHIGADGAAHAVSSP